MVGVGLAALAVLLGVAAWQVNGVGSGETMGTVAAGWSRF
jgi:hypothetical protein